MTCPKCNSEDWKSASFVHQSGTIDVNTSTTTGGIGAGISTNGVGGGVGVSSGSTTGQHQSSIAKITAPPEEPSKPGWIAYAIFIFVIAGMTGSDLWGGLILLGGYLLWENSIREELNKNYKKELKKYHQDLISWKNTRVCQRCGCLYIPVKVGDVSTSTLSSAVTDS